MWKTITTLLIRKEKRSTPQKMKNLCTRLSTLLFLSLPATRADLVAQYQFEDNGEDSVGTADGTPGANVTFDTGISGKAAVFGGSSDEFAETINGEAFDPGEGDFSITFWVKRDQLADTDNADGVLDALNGTGQGYQINFRAGADLNKFGCRLDASNGQFVLIVDPNELTDTENWHHFAVTVDRTASEAKVYRDGVLAITSSIAILTGTISPDRQLSIGGINNNGFLGLDGKLDDLRFYDESLDAAAVAELAVAPPQITPPPLLVTQILKTNDEVQLTWNSNPADGTTYSIFYTTDLAAPLSSWLESTDNVITQGTATTYTLSGIELPATPLPDQLFFVVIEN